MNASTIVAASLLFVASVTNAFADPIGPAWQALGPAPISTVEYTGRVSAIACSPTNTDRYYVGGADGGVWRTTDGGATWTPLTDQMATTAIGAIVLDPTNENVIYAGTGEANFAYHSRPGQGILKSTDGGGTWTLLGESTFAGRCVSKIVIDPSNPLVAYAAITHAGGFLPPLGAAKGHPGANGLLGIFKSLDGGTNWSQLSNGLPNLSSTDVVMMPGTPQTLYAAIGHIFGDVANGVYKSIDAGVSWTKLAGGLPATNVGRISLAIAPSTPLRVFAAIANASNASGGAAGTLGVFRTDNGGTSWVNTTAPSYMATYGWYLNTVAIHPTNPNLVIIGGLTLHRTTTGTWPWIDITPPHVDLHAITWDASGRLLAGEDGGIHRSIDQGDNWSSLNAGLGLIQFYAGVSLHPTSADIMFGGLQDNGTCKRTAPDVWTQIFGGDGGMTAQDQNNPNIVFCEFQGTGNLYRSTNGGTSVNLSKTGIVAADRNCFIPPYELDPSNSQRMFYGTHRVYRSVNGGLNWSPISPDLTATPGGAIHSLAVAPSNSQTIWVTTSDGNVQVTFNDGGNWQLVRIGLPGWFRVMRQVFVAPNDPQTAYLAGSAYGVDQVLRTTNGGANWTALDGDLPDRPVNTIAVDVRPAVDVLYSGTEAGVYRSLDTGQTWRRYGPGLPNSPVVDLRLDLPRRRLVAATQGRGAWTIDVWLSGDIDNNGVVDNADIPALVDVLLGISIDAGMINRSDVNGDGAANGPDIEPMIALLAP